MQMAGFTNYIRLFQDDIFIQSIKHIFYFILQVPIMLVVAMVLACILNKKTYGLKDFPNNDFCRVQLHWLRTQLFFSLCLQMMD